MKLARKTTVLFSLLLPVASLAALALGDNGKSAKKKTPLAKPASTGIAKVSYREEIEPFLKANCGGCHTSAKKTSGFSVEATGELFAGGKKFGAKVVLPGKPTESVIVQYLRGKLQPRMPLGGAAVSEKQIKLVENWIAQGAKIDAPVLGYPYLKPTLPKLPTVKNAAWVKNPIDQFALAKMEASNLTPSPPASKVALLRRVYADLIGLPPTPNETTAFLLDKSPEAYSKVVDRLLNDLRYGERWARHWLDLVRFSETHGFENDGVRPRMWRYRDYVIHALNSDKPYDRFLKEQLAGDELYPDNADALIATGYLRLSVWDELSTDHDQRWQDTLNDVTDVTTSAMLGLTVGCARCHDHKYDKITQADYYRFQGFFSTIQWTDRKLPGETNDSESMKKQVKEADTKISELRGQLASAEKKEDRDKLNEEINRTEEGVAKFRPLASIVTDKQKDAVREHLLIRGDLHTPGEEVKPGFVASLCGGNETAAAFTPNETTKTTGLRSSLANWIASPENPMTARVIVNRLWQHHFGRGIVGTPSDFGINGEAATHKELLDWLTLKFVKDGWSLKKMHRLMLLSNLYQQFTQTNPKGEKLDSQNLLLWRMNRLRLEGEPLRDSILALSGRLNPEMGGPSIYPQVSSEVLSTGSTHKWGNSSEEQGRRRTIYVFQRRSLLLPIVEVFDGADLVNTCSRRNNTTIAPQALALFNSEFTREESRHIAERVVREAGADTATLIDRAYRLILSRPSTAKQKLLTQEFLTKQTGLYTKRGKEASLLAFTDLCHVLINSNEFLYLD